jgi:hypothetical protein
MATALGLAFFAFLHWLRTQDRRQAILGLLLALGCILIKKEGAVWVALLLLAILVARLPRTWRFGLLALPLLAVIAIWLNGGLDIQLPLLGHVLLSPTQLQLPFLGHFSLGLSGSWQPVLYHLFVLDNWHLLALIIPAGLALAIHQLWQDKGNNPALSAGILWVLLLLAALYLLFFWTGASAFALLGTSVNRLLLHFAPSLIFWLMTVWLYAAPFFAVKDSSNQGISA